MNCSITGPSEARLWQGSGPVANKWRPKKPKRSQKGQCLFTGLSWIKTYIRKDITFKVQELRCCFFLLPQPYCLKKNCWGRTSQKPQTAGVATEAAKADSIEQPDFGRTFSTLCYSAACFESPSHCSFLNYTLQQHYCMIFSPAPNPAFFPWGFHPSWLTTS